LEAKLDIWRRLRKRNEKCTLEGGMNKQEFRELFQRYANYLENLIAHPQKARETPEVNIVSRVIVCGTKVSNKP
jgi:hypothetical protein